MDAAFAERPRAEWFERFDAEGVWFAPVHSPADVVDGPAGHRRRRVRRRPGRRGRPRPTARSRARWTSAAAAAAPAGPVPGLGRAHRRGPRRADGSAACGRLGDWRVGLRLRRGTGSALARRACARAVCPTRARPPDARSATCGTLGATGGASPARWSRCCSSTSWARRRPRRRSTRRPVRRWVDRYNALLRRGDRGPRRPGGEVHRRRGDGRVRRPRGPGGRCPARPRGRRGGADRRGRARRRGRRARRGGRPHRGEHRRGGRQRGRRRRGRRRRERRGSAAAGGRDPVRCSSASRPPGSSGGAAQLRAVPPLVLKGKAEPVPAFLLRVARARRGACRGTAVRRPARRAGADGRDLRRRRSRPAGPARVDRRLAGRRQDAAWRASWSRRWPVGPAPSTSAASPAAAPPSPRWRARCGGPGCCRTTPTTRRACRARPVVLRRGRSRPRAVGGAGRRGRWASASPADPRRRSGRSVGSSSGRPDPSRW